ncbi:hypothetical protein [Gloeocapsa sp. PCC 73106]|nr:hypothetical protein [Gloeocapsa sp. PCC 73106]
MGDNPQELSFCPFAHLTNHFLSLAAPDQSGLEVIRTREVFGSLWDG